MTIRGVQAAPKPVGPRLSWAVLASHGVAGLVVLGLTLALGHALANEEWDAEPRDWVLALLLVALGSRIVAHVPANAVGWLLLVMSSFATATVIAGSWPRVPFAAWVEDWAWWPSYAMLPTLALVFPTGRPLGARWAPVVAVSVGGAVLTAVGLALASAGRPMSFWDDAVAGNVPRGLPVVFATAGLVAVVGSLLVAPLALVLRFRRTREPERPLYLWAAASTLLALLAGVLEAANVPGVWVLGALALPAAAVIAIVRHGLFEIDLVIHRSLLYAIGTVGLMLVYTVVVVAVARLLPDRAALFAAAAVVLAAQPVRTRLSRGLDRWLYGASSDPYLALSRFSSRLEQSLAPTDILPTVVADVAAALKVPYVAIRLDLGRTADHRIETGRSRGWPRTVVPMTYQGAYLGDLVVEARAPDERLMGRERRLIEDLARGAAAAAHDVALTEDLRRAREKLVLAREEERRGLRRDLHDGIGAALAGVGMQLRVARNAIERDVGADRGKALRVLGSAAADLVSSSAEIRRLVDGLRPAPLDDGLAEAVRGLASRYEESEIRVSLELARTLGSLPAAVEVAAFHIITEAVANVVRHSGARTCRIRLATSEGFLEVEVVDDGSGPEHSPGRPERVSTRVGGGVGLGSMAERCAELGGTFSITPAPPHGTRVLARLPVPVATPVGGQDG